MRILVALLALHLLFALGFTVLTAAFLAVVRERRVRITSEGIGWFFREWGTFAVLGPLRLLGLWQPAPRASRHAEDRDPAELPPRAAALPPVLLVPGYSLNRGAMIFLATWLRRRGWRWVWPVSHGTFQAPVPMLAHRLARRVEELKHATGASQVDIVGHSMGGLVAAWYVRRLGGASSVRRLVTLGSPWQGTALAAFQLHRAVADMHPDADVLTELAAPSAQGDDVPITALWTSHDNIVLPPERSRAPVGECIELAWIGHHSLLTSARVFRVVGDTLAAPSPAQGDSPSPSRDACPLPGATCPSSTTASSW